MFLAAETVARTQPGKVKRLPEPFIGVPDELRYGVRVANLPYVANVLRKFGISYIYAVQSAAQEDALYGQQGAQELRAAAATSIYGGIDPASARDVADRAGQTAVVRATRTGEIGRGSEQLQMLDTFTVGDQQRLADGESVIIGRGLAPFVAYTRATYGQRGLRRRIGQELTTVTGT
jgi:type IV secretory pathway TraG/TraD family ATPase VirD4